ncbi:iron ABC transporter permease [Pseudonocardia eucalypti]|uniref:Iron ABC transporter permease n=1 Tax=Pseudonocardia eucalypti TaxID=648755 RepID=A0ABP9PLG9_9PSEU|nr:iron complex transport system permease protein [Pseudonocardia eucalypti]
MLLALAGLLLAAMVVSVGLGTVTLPLDRTVAVVAAHLFGDPAGLPPLDEQIIWRLRAPRVVLAGLVGAALALAGAVLQALVRNPLAEPYLLGISSGSSLGAIGVQATGLGVGLGVTGGAFVGALAATLAVFLLAQRSGQLADTRLVLAGVAVGYLAMAGTSLVQLSVDPNSLRGILFWLMGRVAGAQWPDLAGPAVIAPACAALLLARARGLNALALGDDNAAALGVDLRSLRATLLVVSSLLTATCVAAAGAIGFVGLLVPHAARMLFGADHRRLLPVSALLGALLLVLVDLATRMVDRPNEYPITVFTAALGSPFFLWLLRRERP